MSFCLKKTTELLPLIQLPHQLVPILSHLGHNEMNLFILSFIGSSFFACTILAIHLIRPDLSATQAALSKYALGRYGWLLTAGFYSIGLSEIILSLGVTTPANIPLILAGVGAIMVGAFKIELPKKTVWGYLHDLGAGMQFVFYPIALLQLAGLFDGILRTYTIATAAGTILFLLPITYLYFSKGTFLQNYFGAVQKSNIILMNTWVVVVSFLFI